jgi:hypothetical protein
MLMKICDESLFENITDELYDNKIQDTIPRHFNLKKHLSHATQALNVKYSHLLGTCFFVGPLSEDEAVIEVEKYFQDTHPALIYKQNEQYFCIYP